MLEDVKKVIHEKFSFRNMFDTSIKLRWKTIIVFLVVGLLASIPDILMGQELDGHNFGPAMERAGYYKKHIKEYVPNSGEVQQLSGEIEGEIDSNIEINEDKSANNQLQKIKEILGTTGTQDIKNLVNSIATKDKTKQKQAFKEFQKTETYSNLIKIVPYIILGFIIIILILSGIWAFIGLFRYNYIKDLITKTQKFDYDYFIDNLSKTSKGFRPYLGKKLLLGIAIIVSVIIIFGIGAIFIRSDMIGMFFVFMIIFIWYIIVLGLYEGVASQTFVINSQLSFVKSLEYAYNVIKTIGRWKVFVVSFRFGLLSLGFAILASIVTNILSIIPFVGYAIGVTITNTVYIGIPTIFFMMFYIHLNHHMTHHKKEEHTEHNDSNE